MLPSETLASQKDENGTCGFVVQSTLIPVPDNRWNHNAQKKRAHERAPRANPTAGERDYSHPEHYVPNAAADKHQKQHLCKSKNTERSERVVLEKGHGDENAEAPVNDESTNSAAQSCDRSWPSLRQPQFLPRPALFCGGIVRVSGRHHSILGELRNTLETRVIPSRNREEVLFPWLQSAARARTTNRESVHV